MKIGQLLLKKEDQWFVGRESELQFLSDRTFSESDWKFLHVCGPAGIGKTALLKKFQRSHSDKKVLYFSGLEGYTNKELFLQELFERIKGNDLAFGLERDEQSLADFLNQMAEANGYIVLILDTLDKWAPIHNWLREKWVPLLSTKIRFISAARFRLCEVWYRSPGWTDVIQELPLGPLNKRSVRKYMDARGLIDKPSRHIVENYSNGVPFALEVVCNRAIEAGGVVDEKILDFKNLTDFLCQHESYQSESSVSEEKLSDLSATLKKVLLHFRKVESEAFIDRIYDQLPSLSRIAPKSSFRKFLIDTIQGMEMHSAEDQLYARILNMVYVKKVGNHESVASQLNLSMSTYYRYLKKSMDKLALRILESLLT